MNAPCHGKEEISKARRIAVFTCLRNFFPKNIVERGRGNQAYGGKLLTDGKVTLLNGAAIALQEPTVRIRVDKANPGVKHKWFAEFPELANGLTDRFGGASGFKVFL